MVLPTTFAKSVIMSQDTKIRPRDRYFAALAAVAKGQAVRFVGSPYGGHNLSGQESAEETVWTVKEMGGVRKRAKVSHARAIVNSSSLWGKIENTDTPTRRQRRAGQLPWCYE